LKFTPDGKVVYIASNGGEWNDYGYSGGEYLLFLINKKVSHMMNYVFLDI